VVNRRLRQRCCDRYPSQRDDRRLRKRSGKVREHLFTFLSHPEVTADNNGSGTVKLSGIRLGRAGGSNICPR